MQLACRTLAFEALLLACGTLAFEALLLACGTLAFEAMLLAYGTLAFEAMLLASYLSKQKGQANSFESFAWILYNRLSGL